MRQRLHNTHICILALLGFVCLALLQNVRSDAAVPAEESLDRWEATLTAQKHHVPEATLTDAAQSSRICSSRPQRIVSPHSSGSERISNLSGNLARRHNVTPLKSNYDCRCRLETAPFCTAASRQYYIIALRHILC